MKTYGILLLILGVGLLALAYYMSSMQGAILAVIPFYFAFTFLNSDSVNRDACTSTAIGTVVEIKWSGARLNTQKTYNVKVSYNDIERVFKNIGPNAASMMSVGSNIEVKFNPESPSEAYILQ